MKIIKTILIVFGIFSLFYLIRAFIAADFNLNNWAEPLRFGIGFMGGILSIFLGVMFYLESK